VSALLQAIIAEHAARRPRALALRDERQELHYLGLEDAIDRAAATLQGSRVGILADNGCHWAVTDLALARRGAVAVPMPGFFSELQLRHLIADADLDLVVTDQPERVATLLVGVESTSISVAGRQLHLFQRRGAGHAGAPRLPAGTAKVTYTSGTTGAPKGVCLAERSIERVVLALCAAVDARADDSALSLLPLSTLLENIAGLYAPLYSGALAQLPSLASCGLQGSSGLRPAAFFDALQRYAPTSVVLVPQLLKALTEGVAAGLPAPRALRFAAVGGAPVSAELIERAGGLGLPVYQGYGLSEATSVVSINLPGDERPGSVGRPLRPVTVTQEGQIVVHGDLFLGYLGGSRRTGSGWHTGDIGYLDPDGYLILTGRRKTAYATAFGRNVAPEWVEGELTAHPGIAQAALFGEGRASNVAVVMPRGPEARLADAIRRVNTRLPDYARVGNWIVADEPFTVSNGFATAGGALRRNAIYARYSERIEKLYEHEERYVVL